jgi:hypothetical protein
MLADRIARCKAKQPPQDPTGEHHVAIAEIAERTGKDVAELLDLWDERAAIRQYEGCADRAEAERLAVVDVEAMFPRWQGSLL